MTASVPNGTCMRAPKGTPVGSLKRVLINNVVSSGALPELCSIVSGVHGHRIEDVKISDIYLHQFGGGSSAMAELNPGERERIPGAEYVRCAPDHGFVCSPRQEHRDVERGDCNERPDARPAFWLHDVDGADFFR